MLMTPAMMSSPIKIDTIAVQCVPFCLLSSSVVAVRSAGGDDDDCSFLWRVLCRLNR